MIAIYRHPLRSKTRLPCLTCPSRHYASQLPHRPALDFKYFANNVETVQRNADLRNVGKVDVARVAELYREWCQAKFQLQAAQHKINVVAQEMKILLKHKPGETTDFQQKSGLLKAQGAQAKLDLKHLVPKVTELENALYAEAIHIPNQSDPEAPTGPEQNAKVLQVLGSPPAVLSNVKDHVELAHDLKILDLAAGAKVTGTSFYYLIGAGALLELALVQLSMTLAQKYGFTPVSAPDIVKQSVSAACGFHPRDLNHSQNYSVTSHTTTNSDPRWVLSATSEIPLAGMHANETIPRSSLPVKYVSMGRAYRAETGGRGADSRGLYRVHQFTKVELFAFADPTTQDRVWQSILQVQCEMMNALELHARVLFMPTEELGAAASKKIDVEAWMPGRVSSGPSPWGEVSSMSACTDYQSRRLLIRTGPSAGERPFVYTLNGTAAAIPRLIIALLEQHQREDGSVYIPLALRPHLGGMDVIRPR